LVLIRGVSDAALAKYFHHLLLFSQTHSLSTVKDGSDTTTLPHQHETVNTNHTHKTTTSSAQGLTPN
jgi:hypothetical protein